MSKRTNHEFLLDLQNKYKSQFHFGAWALRVVTLTLALVMVGLQLIHKDSDESWMKTLWVNMTSASETVTEDKAADITKKTSKASNPEMTIPVFRAGH